MARHGSRNRPSSLNEFRPPTCSRIATMFMTSNPSNFGALFLLVLGMSCGGSELMAEPLGAASDESALAMDSSGSFTVLAGTAVTCTDTTVTGNVGVSPGTAITQTNCTIDGTAHAADASAT